MRFIASVVAACAAALCLAGCASSGTNFDPVAASNVKPGMTKDQVIAMLGSPNVVTTTADGRQVLAWTHVNVNGLVGSSQVRSVSFIFDEGGRVMKPMGSTMIETRTTVP
jgi:hypothetical protein